MASADSLVRQIQTFWEKADREGRPLSPDERHPVEQLLNRAEQAKEIEGKMAEFGGPPVASSWTGGAGPGDVFVKSSGYKQIKSPDARPQQWSTGPVEVSTVPLAAKGHVARVAPPDRAPIRCLRRPADRGDTFTRAY